MKQFNIKHEYKHRKEYHHFDDTLYEDEHQKEVYELALKIMLDNNYKNIVDYGCGSAYKLVNMFNKYNSIGYEIEPTLSWLKDKYKNKIWAESILNDNIKVYDCDLLVCSDVIEHVLNPDDLINTLLKFKAKKYIISTPDRTIMYYGEHDGPPNNLAHIREWTFVEFEKYISKYFNIIEHNIVSMRQGTQLIVCELKS